MNISYVNFVIERANRSILANENDPNHETYVQKLRDQINAVSYNICLDQEVADLGDLDCDFEIETYLESYVKDLDESIGFYFFPLQLFPGACTGFFLSGKGSLVY